MLISSYLFKRSKKVAKFMPDMISIFHALEKYFFPSEGDSTFRRESKS